MGLRYKNEPPYPQTAAELEEYCARFRSALLSQVGDRLVCLLLCGSWARGEASSPESDADLTVIVDHVDEEILNSLGRAWEESGVGCANVYGADEVSAMSHEALEMYTTNAVVLWGRNPFPLPTREDFAVDLARAAETVARDARTLTLYPWLTVEERAASLKSVVGKWGLIWALKNLHAFRAGVFPTTFQEVRGALAGTPEGDFLEWIEQNPKPKADDVAIALSNFARNWLREIQDYETLGTTSAGGNAG